MNRGQRRGHVGLWLAVAAFVAITITAALIERQRIAVASTSGVSEGR